MHNTWGSRFFEGFFLGVLVGSATALLMAPASGKVIRKQIHSEGDRLQHRAQELSHSGMSRTEHAAEQSATRVANAE